MTTDPNPENTDAPAATELLVSDQPVSTSAEQVPPEVFSHPRGYINEDGEYAIWVGRPPGYENIDLDALTATQITTGTASPISATANREARRSGRSGSTEHHKVKSNFPHPQLPPGRRHQRGR